MCKLYLYFKVFQSITNCLIKVIDVKNNAQCLLIKTNKASIFINLHSIFLDIQTISNFQYNIFINQNKLSNT